MKKLLFTLLLVAGGFVAQAQAIPNIEFTTFNDGAYALGVGENRADDRCVTIKAAAGNSSAITQVGNTLTYTLDASGQLRRNGRTIGSPNAAFLPLFQTGNVRRLYTRQSGGNYVGANIRG